MWNDIKDKLHVELSGEIKSEAQVIYILSRIRKILEIENDKELKVLKFYCDWALHSEIDNTQPVKEMLDGIINKTGDEHWVDFVSFKLLHKELGDFLKKHGLPVTICESTDQRNMFNMFLSEIYGDTPLIIKTVSITTLTWADTKMDGKGRYHGRFKIT